MTNYPTNVSDSQWQIISKHLDVDRNRKYDLREIMNATLYLVKTGCQWRMLPRDFAPWKTVYYYFSVWKKGEVFEIIHEALVEKVRVMQGKQEEPTVGIIDAQSVKSTLVNNIGILGSPSNYITIVTTFEFPFTFSHN
jgi:putative transposase